MTRKTHDRIFNRVCDLANMGNVAMSIAFVVQGKYASAAFMLAAASIWLATRLLLITDPVWRKE